MKKKLIQITVIFLLLFLGAAGFLYVKTAHSIPESSTLLVQINEVQNLGLKGGFAGEDEAAFVQATDSLIEQTKAFSKEEYMMQSRNAILSMAFLCCLFLLILLAYIYVQMIKPFSTLEQFAGQLAKGNLDISLPYERTNYFGEFTWAFDHMREEIVKARECEKKAIENNKTVIATLSHDIKTPIASIRAYAEALEANMDSSTERRSRYIAVIMKKCDEVIKLTNDMFLHSLADLDKLKMEQEEILLKPVLAEFIKEMNGDKGDIHILGEIPDVKIEGDKKRLLQVFGNIIGNSRKYAKKQADGGEGKIEISVAVRGEQRVEISFRDYGQGVPDEDIPFLFEKFYRGKNVAGEEGAGLGLYIVKYILEQMNGEVAAANLDNGFLVTLFLKIS